MLEQDIKIKSFMCDISDNKAESEAREWIKSIPIMQTTNGETLYKLSVFVNERVKIITVIAQVVVIVIEDSEAR